jgi:predicted flap endonuclease-1-like 5' DNA nuclease
VPVPTELSSGSEVLPEPVAEPVRAEDVPQIDEADVVDRPVPVAGGAEPAPVKAEDVPPIDEAAHVVELPIALAAAESPVEAEAAQDQAPTEPVQPEQTPPPSAAEPEEDTEVAARRAIEGGWTPPRRSRTSGPVPHPERASADAEASLANARSSVAAATAAVEAAVAEASVVEPEAQGLAEPAAPGLDFAGAPEAAPQSFLAEGDAAQPVADVADGDLAFELPRERVANVRPEGLAEPRGGVKDDLQRIRGITPALEISLNHLGIFHLDQIGAWDGPAVVWLDHHLGLKGGIARGKWVEQARDLLNGNPQPARPVRR